jgi:hypothetical protein
MSRSYRKHCGLSWAGGGSDKLWRRAWHSSMRAKERDLLLRQIKETETDFCYPIPREVGDLWCAPSDGGTCFAYTGFNDFYFQQTHPRFHWLFHRETPTRSEAWKEWVRYIGK